MAWFRILVDWFGSTNLTFALVICNFIGGLGCGALRSQYITQQLAHWTKIKDKLRLYGLVELLVGVSALMTVAAEYLPADLWGSFAYQLKDGIWFQATHYQIAQVAIAMVCIFVPCLFMGASFPLLCAAFKSTPKSEQFPATLYAWNTFGACCGVLACQFVLILSVGHKPTFWLMSTLNILLGCYFLVRGKAPVVSTSSQSPPPPSSAKTAARLSSVHSLIACAALSGLLAGALEGDMFKRIGFILLLNPGATMSFISFWAVLGIFLASTAVGHFKGLRLFHIKLAYGLAVLFYLATWKYSDELTYLLSRWPQAGEAHHFPTDLTQLFAYTGIYVLPSYFLVSLLLPYACNRLQGAGKHLGLAYGLNTVGFCLGMIAFTLVTPRLNIFYSLKFFLVFLCLGAITLASISEFRPFKRWQLGALALGSVIASLATPRAFDPNFFTPLMWPHSLPAKGLRSNAAHTTYLLDLPNNNTKLFFGRLSMSGTSPQSQQYMRLMAHFPLLVHPQPQKALLVCFGVGNTASAIATHSSIAQIDAVDLNTNVFKTAPELAAHHGFVHLDPRLRMIGDDGRNFLNLSDENYDLITSEPPPPLAGGVYRLYSLEYYRQVLAHLNPAGLMTQWLPVGQLPEAAIELAIRTFVEVFPHSLLFEGSRRHMILVGSPSPIDYNSISQRFYQSDQVVADLAKLGISSPTDLANRIRYTDSDLRRRIEPGPVLSDQHNHLEHLLYDPTQKP